MEMYTLTSIRKLRERGITVHFLCAPNTRLHREGEQMGFEIHTSTARSVINIWQIIRLAKTIRKEQYSIIHTHASKDLWILTPALQLAGLHTRLFLTKHVGSYIKKKDILHRWVYSRVATAFAISTVIAKNLSDTCPLPQSRIQILYDGTDMHRFSAENVDAQAVRQELGIQPGELVLGMTTRFSPGKGHEEFLEAMARLQPEFPKLRGIIVGEASFGEQAYEQQIRQRAANLHLDNVLFTGYRKDTERMYAAMDIFVFPSHSEAFGMALVEAMAMGKPSVCSNSDGVPDIAIDNVTSLLFEKQNAGDLTEKIRQLVTQPELRDTFSRAAALRARKMFDLEIVTDQVISIYSNAIKKAEQDRPGFREPLNS